MSDNIGLANRRLQPLGHISERGNTYSSWVSPSNDQAESAESAESKHQRGGPDSGPNPVSFPHVARQAEPAPADTVKRASRTDVAAKSAAAVVPDQVTRFGAALARQRTPNLSLRQTLTPARRRERDGYAKSGPPENDGRPISVGKDDPLLAMLKRGAR